MFSSMKKRMDDTVTSNDIETIIGKSTHIHGEISGAGNIRVDGHVDGGISIEGNAVIGESGVVNGDVKAKSLIVSGTVNGNAEIREDLHIYATGQLVGDVKTAAFNIDMGGVFKGRSEMAVRPQHDVVVDLKQHDKKDKQDKKIQKEA